MSVCFMLMKQRCDNSLSPLVLAVFGASMRHWEDEAFVGGPPADLSWMFLSTR